MEHTAAGGGDGGDAGAAHHAGGGAPWWGPKAAAAAAAAAASASADVMNQLCRVCGEPAAGFHFGAFTCEGCKSFFGRTYSNLSAISECKNNGECVINKKNRTSCKACRLRKCLLVGMSKSGSRYGRRSNWFKIHCLLQEQQQQQQQQGGADGPRSPKGLWGSKPNVDKEPGVASSTTPPQLSGLPAFPGDPATSAAAFWAQARGSLLQLPTPHLPALPVPFLAHPFLHGAFHPYPHKDLLLPFARPDPVAPSPPRVVGGGGSPVPSSSAAAASAVEKLRALGPLQDDPLDLSLKGTASSVSDPEDSEECGSGVDDEVLSEDQMTEDVRENRGVSEGTSDGSTVKRTAPLDLTTRA